MSDILLRVNKTIVVTGHIKLFGREKYIKAAGIVHLNSDKVDEKAEYEGLPAVQKRVILAILTLMPDDEGNGVRDEDIAKAVQDSSGRVMSPDALRFVPSCL